MNVPYSVEHIDLRAAAQDAKASVSINSPALAAGTTTNLSVIVRAESGAQKTYTIAVSREQDPNYVPDDNTDLASLAVEGFLLSPQFSAKQREYIVYLPYEVEALNISAAAAAALCLSASASLVEGPLKREFGWENRECQSNCVNSGYDTACFGNEINALAIDQYHYYKRSSKQDPA